ncbi:hypothetical protein ADL17_12510 [Micromonospora maris]|uniref:Uncharacterized protein n=1 Tax=Micromonospora maris TaxID=1003110 RepID=A0A9X0HZJ8_9ACTN|nr:hypothetical protein ADL17_12510 [Micromonospora maris]
MIVEGPNNGSRCKRPAVRCSRSLGQHPARPLNEFVDDLPVGAFPPPDGSGQLQRAADLVDLLPRPDTRTL